MKLKAAFLTCLVALAHQSAPAAPPFSGTIFIDPDIITASDPTTFSHTTYAGQGSRVMYDRRVNDWITVNAFLFNAVFNDGLGAEVQVNPEFGNTTAAAFEANKYATVIGRLPTALRQHVQTVWIHQGVQPFGGGNNNLLIHTGQGDLYAADGILEETFVHEGAHTSLDAAHAAAAGWLAAQAADPEFISTYARDNPTREDIAESFLPWLAVRHRPDRISASLASTITSAIPNRLAYFDARNFNLFPVGVSVLESWRLLHFGTTADAGDAANFFDFDRDGFVNVVEFGFGLNPTQAGGVAGMPVITRDAQGRLVIEFVRRKAATNPGIGYIVETGSDFSFAPLDLSGAMVVSLDAVFERVTVIDPAIGMRRFGRVRVVPFSSYYATSGLSVRFNNSPMFTNLPVPGFTFPAGGQFGIGARTGGESERAMVDNVEIIPR